jgi:DNA gyrase subunit A
MKVRPGDQLLGGAVLPASKAKLGVVVISKTGFIKRVPLDEFPVQGRGGQGVVLLNQTKASGPVVAAGAGRMAASVDLIGDAGKRQRLTQVPQSNRANRGRKLVKLKQVTEVIIL